MLLIIRIQSHIVLHYYYYKSLPSKSLTINNFYVEATITTFAQKAVDGAKEGRQSNYPHQGVGKPTLTSAQAKRVDALGIKFEDESVSGEHHHGIFPYSLERPIASHCGRS